MREIRLRAIRLLTAPKGKPQPGALLGGWQAPHCPLGLHVAIPNLLGELHKGVSQHGCSIQLFIDSPDSF